MFEVGMSVAIDRAIIFGTRSNPAEVPTAGEAYFWFDSGSLKYKGSDNVEHTLSTGITAEEVQDIVGALIQSSGSITATYNDASDILTLSVIQSAIDHTQISNRGTNSHAVIDAHIANTSNPHGVTKSQVGLGNVDNTSDINKPISTATQVALNAKYDASNPNGYETPTQLNTRDTNNRNRTNHTGTQLAATISDFNAAADARVNAAISTHEAALDPHPQYQTQAENDLLYSALGHIHPDATTSVAGFMSAADKTKLDGITNDVFLRSTTIYSNTSNATYVTCPELAVNVVAGRVYRVKWTLRHISNATTTGFRPGIGGTATGTVNFVGEVVQSVTASTTNKIAGPLSAFNTNIAATSSAGTQPTVAEIEGIFICTVSGQIYPIFLSEVNGSQVQVLDNSLCIYKDVT
jgi:hypothetical protein